MMDFFRSILTLFLWGCVAVFGICGGLGFVGSVASLDALWNGNEDDWIRISIFSAVWLGIAGGAYWWIRAMRKR